MRVIRFYVSQDLATDNVIKFDDASRHYAINVLRANKNTLLTLFNGDGYDYACEFLTFDKKTIDVRVTNKLLAQKESPLAIKLFLGISKSSHMDYAIQKTVEAGISSIHPLATERTVSKLAEKAKANKLQHWQRIIISACEQCGRAVLPTLHDIIELTQLADLKDNNHGFIFDAGASQSLEDFSQNQVSLVSLLIGPEGGFTRNEINIIKSKGYRDISMGPRILRAETAALAATIASQLLWGDLAD